jgi:hypothetical protein
VTSALSGIQLIIAVAKPPSAREEGSARTTFSLMESRGKPASRNRNSDSGEIT